jgi:phage shock protein E
MTPRHALRTAAAAAVLVVGLAACGSDDASSDTTVAAAAAPSPVSPITAATPDEFVAVIGEPGITLVDVRTPEEFAAGHIDGAINIDFQAPDFADQVGALDKTAAYAIYCHSGNRSGQAEALMAGMGFTDMTDLTGGITAWTEAGMAVVTG